jgi:PAS domain S-box-containing protein
MANTQVEKMRSDGSLRPDLDNLLEGFQIIGFDWRYIYINNAAEIHNHRPSRELIGKTYQEMWPGIEKTEVFRLIEDCLKYRNPHSLDNEFVYPDGTTGWFELRIQPDKDGVLILSIDISGRKLYEVSLKEKEIQYHNLANAGNALIWTSGPDKLCNYFNETWLNYTGRSLEEEIGNGWLDGVHVDDFDFCMKTYVNAFNKRESFEMEYRLRHASGEFRWIQDLGTPNFNSKGEFIGYIGHCFDISDRKLIDAELRASEEKYRYMFASNPQPMWIYDLETLAFLEVNDAAMAIYGYSRDEFLSMTLKDIRPPEDVEALLKDVELTRKIYNPAGEWRHINRDKELMIVEIISHSLTFNGRKARHVIVNNITERKLALEALRASEHEFRLLAESMPQIVWITKPDGWNIYFNQIWVDYTGLSLEESYGHGWNKPFHPDDQQQAWDAWQNATMNGGVYSLECRLRRKDGAYLWWLIRGVPVLDDDGKILKWFGTCTDINELKLAEGEILKLNTELESRVRLRTAQLEVANKELEAFSYSVSHDLRAPLRSISGFSQILLEEYAPKLDGEGKRLFSVIQENSQKMGCLIDDLLAFSRLSRTEMKLSEINMKDLISITYKELIENVSGNNLEFSSGDICNAYGDPHMLKQVLTNLLSNAIKYSSKKEKSVVTVSCNKDQEYCIYCVKDNGVGFDMKYVDKLFGVFQRLHSLKEFEGTGVGLAIVQRIIARHGGRVWALSEIDKGSEFYFSLPVINNN